MKAIIIREFGPPEVMRLEEVPTPKPGPGEVLIQVHAVSVNRTLDLIVRSGKYARPIKLPHVLGVDPSGVVAAVGEGVTSPRVGDRVVTLQLIPPATPGELPSVLGVQMWGGYAEYVVVPARITRPIPDGVDFAMASVVSRHAPVAFALLRDEVKLQRDEWVLVMGATGGLGSAGIQVARYMGAKVIAAAGADERVKAALELGAEHGVNYRSEDLAARVREITGGRGVQVVFENIGDPDLFPKALASLARKGRLVTAGSHGGGIVPLNVTQLYMNAITIIGSIGGVAPNDVDLSLRTAAEGKLRVFIDRVLPLSQAPEAHRIVAERSGIGKVVLQPTRL